MTSGKPGGKPGDKAGVIAPPPLLFAGAVVLGLALDRWVVPAGFGLSNMARQGGAGVLVVAGLALGVAAFRLFSRAGTHVEPWKPSTALVTDGVYRWTRNPMYVGMSLLQAGLALVFDSVAVLAMLVPLLVVLRYGVIAREERYLAAKFPDQYAAYRQRVRRWL
jgi:protein-S-isoprenylcysteine O-methyltransferase Ste14